MCDRAARLADTMLRRVVEPIEDRRELLLDIGDVQILRVERVLAVLAIPEKTILLVGTALLFEDEPYGLRESLWRVRHAHRKQEDLDFPHRNRHVTTVLHRAQHH